MTVDDTPANEAKSSRKRPRLGGGGQPVDADAAASSATTTTAVPQKQPELATVDWSRRIQWGRRDKGELVQPLDAAPSFPATSPALCHILHAVDGYARAGTLYFPQTMTRVSQAERTPTRRPVPTPMFMPVGTKGCLKALPWHEVVHEDSSMQCPLLLGNTYHLAIQPGTDLVDEMGGLHAFQGLPEVLEKVQQQSSEKKAGASALESDAAKELPSRPYNLLTDSGGFQMVSLLKLSEVTEEGVSFVNPFSQSSLDSKQADNTHSDRLLLRPEDSIAHQHKIGANIIMALDDVVSSVHADQERFVTATHRTLRWFDRCYQQHQTSSHVQNLFPIVQGGLDVELGGLREQCLAGFRIRETEWNYVIPGYAIGGLAGGEDKEDFWQVVHQCCQALPDDKPRYLMGVGYPLDLVVCTALGCDLYDCVYPTRTARFGVALVNGPAPGTLRLKSHESAMADDQVIQTDCPCQACRRGISRARLHAWLKTNNPVAVQLVTQHNVTYMMQLVAQMRQAILHGTYATFVRTFVRTMYPGTAAGGDDCPKWVVDALAAVGIGLA